MERPMVSTATLAARCRSLAGLLLPCWPPLADLQSLRLRPCLDVEGTQGDGDQPVRVIVDLGLEDADAPAPLEHPGLSAKLALGDRGQVVDLDLERRASLVAFEAGDERRTHGGVDQAVDHATVDQPERVQLLGPHGGVEARAAVVEGDGAEPEQFSQPARARAHLNVASSLTSIRYGPPLASARPMAPATSADFSTRSPGTPSEDRKSVV